jgi:hypothetical protein
LQQHAQALRGTVFGLFHEFAEVADSVSTIQDVYKISKVANKIVDGDQTYPNSTVSTNKGMAFELKCAESLITTALLIHLCAQKCLLCVPRREIKGQRN